jgi:cytidylate kinase
MAVITLSRELGSLGTKIADTLSSLFGYAKLDKDSLEILLKELGMPEPEFEGNEEKKPGFWEQFIQVKDRYLDFMKAAMYRFASVKDCIIVGRSANIIFRGIPGTLRLRVIAPHDVRVARLRERFGIDEQHALRMMERSDHDRAGYHKYFFNAIWDSPADFDLVVNTATISPAEICDTVSALFRSPAHSGVGKLARDILLDLCIAQEVKIAIIHRQRVLVTSLDVVCEKGVVALHGVLRSAEMDRCVQIADTVEGVVKVVSHLEAVENAFSPGI